MAAMRSRSRETSLFLTIKLPLDIEKLLLNLRGDHADQARTFTLNAALDVVSVGYGVGTALGLGLRHAGCSFFGDYFDSSRSMYSTTASLISAESVGPSRRVSRMRSNASFRSSDSLRCTI